MDEMTYSVTKYTISKLIDKLTWAEHTAGALQAENERLQARVKELEAESNGYHSLYKAQFDANTKLEKLYEEKTGEEAPFLLF